MDVTLRLKYGQLRKLRKLARLDTDTKLAKAMGVHPATVSRVLAGKQAPGPQFMAALVMTFEGFDLDDFFEVIEDERQAA